MSRTESQSAFERRMAEIKMMEDRRIRGNHPNSKDTPVIAPPLPEWAEEGKAIPRCNVGPNVTQARIDRYKERAWRNFGRRINDV